MTELQLKWMCVVAYLVVDVIYVVSSRGFYEQRIRAIQAGQKGFATKPDVLPVALLTYVFMGIGWWWLVAAQIRPDTTVLKTLGIAAAFALIVHGVFNGTVYAMFDGWDKAAFGRDLLWGFVWIPTITLIYRYAIQRV